MTITANRFFGRIVRLSTDSDGDGRIDDVWRYSWKRPYYHHRNPQEMLSDTNRDGHWDTWATPIQDPDSVPLGELEWRYRLDTTADQETDIEFIESDPSSAQVRISKEFGIE